jgi:hypothetical protein
MDTEKIAMISIFVMVLAGIGSLAGFKYLLYYCEHIADRSIATSPCFDPKYYCAKVCDVHCHGNFSGIITESFCICENSLYAHDPNLKGKYENDCWPKEALTINV